MVLMPNSMGVAPRFSEVQGMRSLLLWMWSLILLYISYLMYNLLPYYLTSFWILSLTTLLTAMLVLICISLILQQVNIAVRHSGTESYNLLLVKYFVNVFQEKLS